MYPNLSNSKVCNLGWCTAKLVKTGKGEAGSLFIFSHSDDDGISQPPTEVQIHGNESIMALYQFLKGELE